MKDEEIQDEVQDHIKKLQDRIAFLEEELQDSEHTVRELKQELESIDEERRFGELPDFAARLKDTSDSLISEIEGKPDQDLSGVWRELDLADEEWNEGLPDDPMDLTDH